MRCDYRLEADGQTTCPRRPLGRLLHVLARTQASPVHSSCAPYRASAHQRRLRRADQHIPERDLLICEQRLLHSPPATRFDTMHSRYSARHPGPALLARTRVRGLQHSVGHVAGGRDRALCGVVGTRRRRPRAALAASQEAGQDLGRGALVHRCARDSYPRHPRPVRGRRSMAGRRGDELGYSAHPRLHRGALRGIQVVSGPELREREVPARRHDTAASQASLLVLRHSLLLARLPTRSVASA
ncbi:hypothetical protein EV715DRAFT_213470 [Schizophyllum commune]